MGTTSVFAAEWPGEASDGSEPGVITVPELRLLVDAGGALEHARQRTGPDGETGAYTLAPLVASTADAVARTSLTSAPSLQQVVYTVTELVAAVTNYRMLDKRKPSNGPGLIMMGVVGTAHTLQSLADEALYNILLLRGALSPPPLPPPARTWPSG